jgi:hypothetical protein
MADPGVMTICSVDGLGPVAGVASGAMTFSEASAALTDAVATNRALAGQIQLVALGSTL